MNVRSRLQSKCLTYQTELLVQRATNLMTTRSSGSTMWVVIFLVAAPGRRRGIWLWKRSDDKTVEYQSVVVGRGEVTTRHRHRHAQPVTNVTVGSQISGIIQTLSADFNTRVERGQSSPNRRRHLPGKTSPPAEGDLANANANLELTQVDFRRAEELFKSQLIAKSDFDKAAPACIKPRPGVKMKASLQRAQSISPHLHDLRARGRHRHLAQCRCRPDRGGQHEARPRCSSSRMIWRRCRSTPTSPEADVGGVREGQDVEFTVDAFPYRTFHGKVGAGSATRH